MRVYEIAAFNTLCNIQAYSDVPVDQIDAVLAEVAQECERFERLFSHTLPESSLVRLNNAGGAPVEVEPELAELIASALHYCEATNGLFDITVGPLVALWNNQSVSFGDGVKMRHNEASDPAGNSIFVPTAAALAQACEHVDWRKVRMSGNTVQLEDPQARIVLGGIAKGYIADALCTFMQVRGIAHGFVNLGGNVKVFGGAPSNRMAREIYGDAEMRSIQVDADGFRPFVVGLRVPKQHALPNDYFATVQLRDGSVVTSGIYERSIRTEDGTFYHHILDPHTGMPAETDLVSASLISETSLDGDGYTTALICMGLERARAFVEALPNCEAVFVDNTGKVHATSGIGATIPFNLM